MRPECAVQGCTREAVTRGWCDTHYTRWRRKGDPGPAFNVDYPREGSVRPPTELFWAKVNKDGPGGCWLWTACDRHGYGTFSERLGYRERRLWLAHRYAYTALIGPIPDGLVLDHLCRVTLCVNPAHLEPVTDRVNIIRGESPGGRAFRLDRCKRGHEFTPENTRTHPQKFGRGCKECERVRAAERANAEREDS